MNKVNLNASHIVRLLQKAERVVLDDVLRLERAGDDLLAWVRQVDGSVQLQRLQDFYLPGQEVVLVVEPTRAGEERLLVTAQTELPSTVLVDSASTDSAVQDVQGDVLWLQMLAADLSQLDAPFVADAPVSDAAHSSALTGVYQPVVMGQTTDWVLPESLYAAEAKSHSFTPQPIRLVLALMDDTINRTQANAQEAMLVLGEIHSEPGLTLHVIYRSDSGEVRDVIEPHGERTDWVWTPAQKQAFLARLGQGEVSVEFYYEASNGQRLGDAAEQRFFIDTQVTAPTVDWPLAMADGVIERQEVLAGLAFEGQAEAYSTVNLKWAGSAAAFASVQTDGQGRWKYLTSLGDFPVGSPQVDLEVSSVDRVGNASETVTEPLKLQLAPAAPSMDVPSAMADGVVQRSEAQAGVLVTGRAEAGTTVSLHWQGSAQTLASVVVDANGHWAYTLPFSQTQALGNGLVQLQAQSKDKSGHTSAESSTALTLQLDLPAPVVDAIVAMADGVIERQEVLAGLAFEGQAEAYSTVNLKWAGSAAAFASVQTDGQGRWKYLTSLGDFPVGSPQVDLEVSSVDRVGHASETVTEPLKLQLAPAAPSMDAPSAMADGVVQRSEAQAGVLVTGRAEAGTTVSLHWQGSAQTLASVVVDANGHWAYTLPFSQTQALGNGLVQLQAQSKDKLGHTSAVSSTALTLQLDLLAPRIYTSPVLADGVIDRTEALAGVLIQGSAEPLSSVHFSWQGGGRLFDGTADAQGQWQFILKLSDFPMGAGQGNWLLYSTDDAGGQSALLLYGIRWQLQMPTPWMLLPEAMRDGVIDRAEATAGVVLQGQAEAHSTVSLRWLGENSAFAVVPVDAQGRWQYTASLKDFPPRVDVATIQVQSADAMGYVSEASTLDLHLDLSLLAPTVDAPLAMADGFINRSEAAAGVLFQGQAEAGSVVSLKWSSQSSVFATVVADAQGRWQYTASIATLSVPGNGVVALQAQSTDVYGNTSAMGQGQVHLQLTLPDAPTAALDAQSQTGLSTVVTQDTTPTYKGRGPANGRVLWYQDVNGDHQIDGAETWIAQAHVGSDGQYTITLPSLDTGAPYAWLLKAVDVAGNVSEKQTEIFLEVDTQAPPAPVLDTLAGGDGISFAEFSAGVALSGHAEAHALVTVVRTQGDTVQTATVSADALGQWRLPWTAGQWGGFVDGLVRFSVTQTDLAGLVSEPATLSALLRVSAVASVSSIQLSPQDDTGYDIQGVPQFIADGVTRVVQPRLEVHAAAGSWVRLIEDTNSNGLVDASEAVLAQLQMPVSGASDWSFAQALGDGHFRILAVGWDPVSGSYSNVDPLTGLATVVDARLDLTIDTHAPEAPTLGAVGGDDNVVSLSEIAAGVILQGTAEPHAKLNLNWSHTLAPMQLAADEQGVWRVALSPAQLYQLGGGRVTVTVTATDTAGNSDPQTSVLIQTFEINTTQPAAPSVLSISEQEDRGRSPKDAITSDNQLSLMGRSTANAQVDLFDDVNNNGIIDVGEWLGTVVADAHGDFSSQKSFADGVYRLRAIAVVGGNSSVANDSFVLQVDAHTDPVTGVVMAQNNQINIAKRDGGTTLSGQGEAAADVVVTFADSQGQVVLDSNQQPMTWTARVNPQGVWGVALSSSQIAALPQGMLTARVMQISVGGAQSVVVSHPFELDTVAPGGTASAQAQAQAVNANSELSDGLDWLELKDGTQVAVALPDNLGSDGSLTLLWGNQNITHSVTASETQQGYALVDVPADAIFLAGANNALSVSALFVDKLGNPATAAVQVLQQQVTMSGQPPSAVPDAASYHRWVDGKYYSKEVQGIDFELNGLPGATVVLYEDINGNGQLDATVDVTVRVQLDGQGYGSASLVLPVGEHVLRTFSTLQGSNSQTATSTITVVVDNTSPDVPTLNPGYDDLISAAERDAPGGILIGGVVEPDADVTYQLYNEQTRVLSSVYTVRAGAQGSSEAGQWSARLNLAQWIQVGDGTIRILLSQTDKAGNVSPAVLPANAPSLVLDTLVRAPTINAVTGNDVVNASEAAAGFTLSGGAEPQANVRVSLSGGLGSITRHHLVAGNDGFWSTELTSAQLLQILGEGPVTITIGQTDKAGNVSSTGTRTFLIDTRIEGLSLQAVGTNNHLNAAQTSENQVLEGEGEVGAVVTVVLTNGTHILPAKTTTVANNGHWQMVLTPTEIATGLHVDTSEVASVAVDVSQTDLAGNTQALVASHWTIDRRPLPGQVTLAPVGGDENLSYSEQASPLLLSGTGPVGTQVYVRLVGAQGTVQLGPVGVSGQGQWQTTLTSEQMHTSLGPGEVKVLAWAVDPETLQSSAVQDLDDGTFVLQGLVPAPVVERVGGDGFVNAEEAQAGQWIQGTGEPGDQITLSYTGTRGQFTRTAAVGVDGSWLSNLSLSDVNALGQGTVRLSVVQSTGSNASIAVAADFEIDTVLPQPPRLLDAQAAQAARAAGELAGGVTAVEASDGVVVALPLHADARVGDKIELFWGTQDFVAATYVLTEADLTASNTRVLPLTVLGDAISRVGSGAQDLVMRVTDTANNVGSLITVVSGLSVSAPPRAPQISSVMTDGYINQAEFAQASVSPDSLRVSGTSDPGQLNLTIVRRVDGNAVSSLNRSVTVSGGEWFVRLSQADMDTLGEGGLEITAQLDQGNGVVSVVASRSIVFDKTLPAAVTAADAQRALEKNAKGELAGGLIAMADNNNLSEAYAGTLVHVGLAADAQSGDTLVLYWGSGSGVGGTEIAYTVTQTDILNRYAAITVSEEIITTVGDSNNLRVEARAMDRAGNPGSRFEVWSGVVDAVPAQPSLFSIGVDGWINSHERDAGVVLSGQGLAHHRFELVVTSGAGAQMVTIHKNALNQVVNAQGLWSLELSSTELASLGQGDVQVKVRQIDVPTIEGMPGNPSRWQTGGFTIDTIAPEAPGISRIAQDDRISQIESVNGVVISGTAEASARVNLTVQDGTTVLTTLMAIANDQGQWQVPLTDFTGWTTSQSLQVLATQTDVAGNVSTTQASRSFSYSSQMVQPPAAIAVFGASSQDIYFNAQDLADPLNPVGQVGFTVSGEGSTEPGSKVRLEIEMAGVLYTTDPVLVNNGLWAVHMAQPPAQGPAVVRAVQISPQGDESAAALYPHALVIDTVLPELQVAQISVQDSSGNLKAHAKVGDELWIKLRLSEGVELTLNNNQNPTLPLNLGGAQLATYNAAASQAAGSNVLVFKYTVQPGDAVLEGGLGLLVNAQRQFAVDWQGAQVSDAAGNRLNASVVTIADNTIRVDTGVPLAPVMTGLVAADGGSVAANDATSAGGTTVNLQELVDGKTVLRLDLTHTGALANDKLKVTLSWPQGSATTHQVVEKTLLASDIAANAALVTLEAALLSGLEKTVTLTAVLEDVAGNTSPVSSALQVTVDSVVATPGIGVVGGDDRLSKVEVDALMGTDNAITFSNIEAGATVSARLVQTLSGVTHNITVPVTALSGDGQGVTKQALAEALDRLQDGVWAWEVTQTDLAGNTSALSSRAVVMDRVVPNAASIEVEAASDNWVNKAEVQSGLSVKVRLDGTSAGVGDQLKFSWQLNPNLVQTHEVTLEQAQITAGFVTVLLPADKLLQTTDDVPQALHLSVYIEDRGGNESPVTAVPTTVKLDTVVATPVVLVNGADAHGHLPTVSPAVAQLGGTITGTAEEGASVVLVLRGEGGDTLRFPLTGSATGTFTATISPNDYTLLGGGLTTSVVNYSVVQTDRAGNISETAAGSFELQLRLPAPTFIDLTNDNLINLSESGLEQTLQGLGTEGATVSVTFYDSQNQLLTTIGTTGTKTSQVTSGAWRVNLSVADFAAMGSGTIKAVAKQSWNGSDSAEQTMSFVVDRAPPTLAVTGAVSLFDGNADGDTDDALLVTFSENVKAYHLKETSVWFTGIKNLGVGARIETVNEQVINGATFARQYRIYLGQGATLAAGDTIQIAADKIEDTTGNTAQSAQTITVPSLAVPARPVPQLNISGDNYLNAAEAAASTSIQYTYTGVATGSKVRLFSNSVQLAEATVGTTAGSTTTATTFNLSGLNTWGADGGKTLTAQIVSSDGKTGSLISVPKTITLDTVVAQGFQLEVLSDQGTSGQADAGDIVRVTLNETMALSTTVGHLTSSWGTGATVSAVGAVNGFSTVWDVKLGSNAALTTGSTLGFLNAKDLAGNVISTGVKQTLNQSVFSQLGRPVIDNVTTDNVIDSAEKSSLHQVKVNLMAAQSNDEVQLFLDGKMIGRKTVNDASQKAVTFDLSVDDWGGDGEHRLSAVVVRGLESSTSASRSVYVNLEQTHWSKAVSGTFWFDPDVLNLTDGTSVTSWNANVGTTTMGAALSVSKGNGSVVKLTDASGHVMLWFDGRSSLNSTALIPIPTLGGGYADFSMFKTITPVDMWSYTMTRYVGNGTATPFRHHFGTASGYGVTSHFASDGNWKLTTPSNSTTANVWMVLNGFASGATTTSNTMAVAVDQNILGSRTITSASDGGVTAGTQTQEAKFALVLGGSSNGASPTLPYAGQMVTALMADQIGFNVGITAALRGEVSTYLAAKYKSVGHVVLATAEGATYDLSAQAGMALLDDIVTLHDTAIGIGNDTVITAGADYVNTGRGDDRIEVKDLNFRTLDGGLGRDKWVLSADYAGRTNIVLSDFVSNARGMSGVVADDVRVNAAGFHKLQGLEALDLSTSSARQILTVKAADVAQLSETNRLEVMLGSNDVLPPSDMAVHYGHYLVNGTHYDAKYTADSVEMYVRGGMSAPDLEGSRYYSNAIQLDFNTAMYGAVNMVEFEVNPLGAGSIVSTLLQVSPVNVRQGVYLTFKGPVSSPVKVTYSGAMLDEYGRSFEHKVWGIGTDSNDTLDASAWELNQGAALSAGAGSDHITGTIGSDVIVGGLGSDTITGGAGADRFRYITINEGTGGAGGLGGLTGDVITDFNTSANSADADVLDLSQLFASTLATNGNAQHDAAAMVAGGYIDLVKTNRGQDLQVFIDRDGGGAMGLLATLQGVGTYTSSVSGESTEQLLQRLLTEGRMQVSHA